MSAVPKVSVVLPVRDGERFLDEALDSVLGQSLRDLELVAVDDGSTDSSRAILERAAGRDARVRVVPGTGAGISAATNLGLAQARAGLIAFMDQDDRCRPRRLERQAAFLEAHADVGAVGGWIHRFGAPGLGQGRHPTVPADCEAALPFSCPLHGGTVLLRRSTLADPARTFDPAEDGSQDWGLWARLAEAGVRLANLPEFVLDYRVHPGQASVVQAARQAEVSSGIRARGLRRLGLTPSPAERELHDALSEGRWRRDLGWLRAVEAWLLKLRAACRDAGWPDDPAALDRALARRWSAALWGCRGMGTGLYRLAAGSPLRALPDPQAWKPLAARWGAFLPGRRA